MKICYFGGYERDHPRNIVLLQGLRQQGVEVVECHSRHSFGPLRYPILATRYLQLCLDVDLVFVAAGCHKYMFLAWALARLTHKSIVFDPFFSLYDTLVKDRELASVHSVRAAWYWFLDKAACTLADCVLADTDLHAEFFSKMLGSNKQLCVVPVGADESMFYAQSPTRRSGSFEVIYAGSFIPLHGVEYILEAAGLLRNEDFHFTLIGDGQTFARCRQMARDQSLANVDFVGRLPRQMYAERLRQANIALGIFGSSEKAQRVIPCKIYDAIAAGKPTVTGCTPAVRAVFTHGQDIFLCRPADGHALADALQQLKQDEDLRYRIASGAEALFKRKFSTKIIGQLLQACLCDVTDDTTVE